MSVMTIFQILSLSFSPDVFCKKRCSLKFRKIYNKTPVPESFLDKVAGQVWVQVTNLQFRINILHFFLLCCVFFQHTFTSSKLTIETQEKDVEFVQR